MTTPEDANTAAGGSPVERGVRPRAWEYVDRKGWVQALFAEKPHDLYPCKPLYDQAALDAALNLWPRDCRLCAQFTTKTGGCTSLVQCVDSMQFKATAPRQYWRSGPNARAVAQPTAPQE